MAAEKSIKQYALHVPNTSAVLIGPNPRRQAIILTGSIGGSWFIRFGEPAILEGSIGVLQNSTVVTLTRELIGDQITQSINGISDAVSLDVSLLEVSST